MSASESSPASPASAQHDTVPAWVVVMALSLLTGLQPIATDLYLPALPQMQRDLGLSAPEVQWTLSAMILAFGIGQLIWGPISDRFGRRPVLRWGLGFFVLASVMTTLAQDLHMMILARVAQGASLSAAVMCGRAMVRDLYPPEQGARMMAKGMSGLGVLALGGPILGGLSATYSGWRATMGVIGLLALAVNLGVAVLLYAYRNGDAQMRSVWLCSRNDAIGNVAVMLAAAGVFGTGQAWPDLLVACFMSLLAMRSGWAVLRAARHELSGHTAQAHQH